MRIACISASWLPGISANAIQLMKACEALVELGHEIRLLVPDFGEDLAWRRLSQRYGLRSRFDVIALPQRFGLGRYDFALRAVRAAGSWAPNLHYVWPLQVAGLSSIMGRPTLLEMHDVPGGALGPIWFRFFLSGRGAKRLLLTTESLRQKLAGAYGARRVERLGQVAPNAVDLAAYAHMPDPAGARDQLGLDQTPTAVYTGHLYPGRGARFMLELAKLCPEIQFVLAGGEPEDVAKVQALAKADNIGNVVLLGFVDHAKIPLVQAAGEVLLMPYGERIEVSGGGNSAEVASPMKAFEYLAAARPIISSDLPVLREVLDETTAVLLPPRQADRWQHKLRELVADRAERARLSAAAGNRAQHMSWADRARRALEGLDG